MSYRDQEKIFLRKYNEHVFGIKEDVPFFPQITPRREPVPAMSCLEEKLRFKPPPFPKPPLTEAAVPIKNAWTTSFVKNLDLPERQREIKMGPITKQLENELDELRRQYPGGMDPRRLTRQRNPRVPYHVGRSLTRLLKRR